MGMSKYIVLAALALASTGAVAQEPPRNFLEPGTEIVAGCQGEGCGCTEETSTKSAFTLRKSMHAQSPTVGVFQARTRAKLVQTFAIVREPGEYVVTSVAKQVGLKPGDRFFALWDLGEGFMKARIGQRRVSFEAGDIEYSTVKEAKYDQWHLLSVGAAVGFSRTFPFNPCFS